MKKKKYILIGIVVVLAIICIVCISIYFVNKYMYENKIRQIEEQNISAFLEDETVYEYGAEINVEELKNKLINTTLLYENTTIKINGVEEGAILLDFVGNLDIEIILVCDETIVSKIYTFEVKDTILPTIEGFSDKTITQGDEIDLKEGIKATDPIDGELEVIIEGEFNKDVVGEYTIVVKAVDSNNNEKEESFKVTVNEKVVEKTTTTGSKSTSSSNSSNSSSSSSSSATSTNDASTKAGREALAKAEAKVVASKIFKSGMTQVQKAKAIGSYLANNVSSNVEQSNEAYKTNFANEAYGALVLKAAACSGYCRAAVMLCNQAGIQCKHINSGQWTHQWLEVYIDGNTYILDPQINLWVEGNVHPFM